jgi:SAM-dependent methyltransferase
VIGVDMTPEMISKARDNVRRVAASNVEFRLGEIEHLPASDASADVVLSNCVINLSPDKAAVFREAIRVLKPGGRLAISDVVATAAMPHALAQSLVALTGCVAGAASVETVRGLLADAGFVDVVVEPRADSAAILGACMPGAEGYVASASIQAQKPGGAGCCAPSCCNG